MHSETTEGYRVKEHIHHQRVNVAESRQYLSQTPHLALLSIMHYVSCMLMTLYLLLLPAFPSSLSARSDSYT